MKWNLRTGLQAGSDTIHIAWCLYLSQKTREGCGCFWGPCGSSGGKSRENSGKIAGKIFPESPNATNSRILGTGKGKPAGNLGSTLPGPCPHLPCGVFFEIDSSTLLEFFWLLSLFVWGILSSLFVWDAAFLLTVGSFLLTVEPFYLQLTGLAFLLTVGAFLLTILAFLLTVGAFLLAVP